MSATTTKLSIYELHRRLGHIDQRAVLKLVGQGNVLGVHLDHSSVPKFCEVCVQAKGTQAVIPTERSQADAERIGDVVHSDLWGPAPVATLGG